MITAHLMFGTRARTTSTCGGSPRLLDEGTKRTLAVGWRSLEMGLAPGVLVLFLVGGAGCGKETKAKASPEPQTPQQIAAPAEPTPAQGAEADPATKGGQGEGATEVSSDTFVAKLVPPTASVAGKSATLTVDLEAKAPFKVNAEYPVRFRLSSANGFDAPEEVGKDAAKIEGKHLTLPIAVTPTSSGAKRIEGTFFFSVCTDDKCLMEQRDLAVSFQVAAE